MRLRPDPVDPDQESVWRHPLSAITKVSDQHIRIEHDGILVAASRSVIRTLETNHPSSWYLQPADLMRPC